MKGEAAILGPAAFVAMIGELVNDLNGSNPHFWHHIILEGAAIMLCVLCYIVYKLEVRSCIHSMQYIRSVNSLYMFGFAIFIGFQMEKYRVVFIFCFHSASKEEPAARTVYGYVLGDFRLYDADAPNEW